MANHWWARLVLGRTLVSDPLHDAEQPDTRPDSEWRPPIKTRLLVLLGVLGVWAIAVEAQLVRLQMVDHEMYQKKANLQQQYTLHPEAPRGDITDRNGQLLAYSVESYDVHADPAQVVNVADEVRDICQAFGDCTADDMTQLTAKLTKPKSRDVIIRTAKMLAPDASDRLQRLIEKRAKAAKAAANATRTEVKLPVLWLDPHIWRYYPKRELAAHAVGFIRADGVPGGGVESRFDSTISGVKGEVIAQRDGRSHEIFTRVKTAPTLGTSIELTIDQTIQYFADREIKAVVEATRAASGSIVVMDPRTGEILGLSSFPNFNPNDPAAVSSDFRRNRAVQDVYEPGSTFKIVTVSAAINDGLMKASDLIDTNPGWILPAGRSKRIDEAHGRNYGVLSLEDVIVRSSNVGAARVGIRVGADRMAQYVQRLGFGQKIAPNLAGESKGIVNPPSRLTESALASLSMGYEIGVTPIQMATAASVVANGGLLMEPHIVRAEIQNGVRREVQPHVVHRAITAETAATITTMMEGVVELKEGTGKLAALERYRVAGKTGTASKAIKGGYSKTDYNVSFVGFVPSRDPVLTILVVVDSPQVGSKYGGSIAAPVFKRVAEAALQYLGVAPSLNPPPPVMIAGDHSLLPRMPPRESAAAPTVTRIGGRPVMPDLRGMSMRKAVRVAALVGLPLSSMDGDGEVVSQTPEPGTVIGPSSRGSIELRRRAGPNTGGVR